MRPHGLRREGLAAAGASACAAALIAAGSAHANYYGTAYDQEANFGGTAQLITRGIALNPAATFVDNDIWAQGTNGAAGPWVEGGLIDGTWGDYCTRQSDGTFNCTQSSTANGESFFAGEESGTVYQGHQGPSASIGTYYQDYNTWGGGNTWYVTLEPVGGGNPTWSWQFTDPFGSGAKAPELATGTEMSGASDALCQQQANVQTYQGNGVYNTFNYTNVLNQNPPTITPLTTPSSNFTEYANTSVHCP